MKRFLTCLSVAGLYVVPAFAQSSEVESGAIIKSVELTNAVDASVKHKDCQPLPGTPSEEEVRAAMLAEMQSYYDQNHALEGFDKEAYEARIQEIKTWSKKSHAESAVYYDQLPPQQN